MVEKCGDEIHERWVVRRPKENPPKQDWHDWYAPIKAEERRTRHILTLLTTVGMVTVVASLLAAAIVCDPDQVRAWFINKL